MLAVWAYMFYVSFRKVSRVLSIALDPLNESTAHDLAKKVSSSIAVAVELR